jgi:hypothetical protein
MMQVAAAILAFVNLICRLLGLNPWLYSPVELRERGYPLDRQPGDCNRGSTIESFR